MDKKEFAAIALNSEHKTYVVHVGSVTSLALPSSSPLMLNDHTFFKPQISGLIAEKASIKVPNEYLNFVDIFSLNLVSTLSKHTGINDHAIKQVDGQQLPYSLSMA